MADASGWAALAFAIAFAFCALAASYGFHPAVTRACILPCVAGLIGCAAWLRLKGDDQQ